MKTSSSGSRACTLSATIAASSIGDSTVLRRSFGPTGMSSTDGRLRHLITVFSLIPYRSEEHTSELQSLMRISYAVFCLKKKKKQVPTPITDTHTLSNQYLI